MPDVSKFQIGGTIYNVKDAVARSTAAAGIADLSINSNKIANGAITSDKIANGAIDSNKLANEAVSFSNLSNALRQGYVRVFNTVAEMQDAVDLQEGMICHTNGFHEPEDNGAAYYTIMSNQTSNNMNILACQNDLFAVLTVTEGYVTPEMYGAYGDGSNNDTPSINAAFASGWRVECRPTTYQVVNTVLMQLLNNITINGNGGTLRRPYTGNPETTIFGLQGCTDININNLNITTTFDPTGRDNDIGDLANYGSYGLSVAKFIDNSDSSRNKGCSRINIIGCKISYVLDGISVSDSSSVTIANNYIHDIGQEPIVVRQTYDVIITENHCWAHLGDGILVKYHTSERADKSCNVVISNNTLYDPKQCNSATGNLQCGGGITVNAENTDQKIPTRGIIITNNTIDGCRYGVQLANVIGAVVDGNSACVGLVNGSFLGGSCAFGIAMSKEWTAIDNVDRVLFSNNIAVGGSAQFRSYSSGDDISVTNIIFDNNIGNALKIGDTVYPSSFCVEAWNTTFTNNIVSGGQYSGRFWNCTVRDNQFLDPDIQGDKHNTDDPDLAGTSTLITLPSLETQGTAGSIQFRGSTCIVENNTIDAYRLYSHCGNRAVFRNNNFNFKETKGLVLQCDDAASIWLEGNLYNGQIIVDDNLSLYGKTQSIFTDFYRTFSAIDPNSNSVGLIIKANRDTLQLTIDFHFKRGNSFYQVTNNPYFVPHSGDKQIVCHVVGVDQLQPSVARLAFRTSGFLTVMTGSIEEGQVITTVTIPK